MHTIRVLKVLLDALIRKKKNKKKKNSSYSNYSETWL